jgi:hypothetical protein
MVRLTGKALTFILRRSAMSGSYTNGIKYGSHDWITGFDIRHTPGGIDASHPD